MKAYNIICECNIIGRYENFNTTYTIKLYNTKRKAITLVRSYIHKDIIMNMRKDLIKYKILKMIISEIK